MAETAPPANRPVLLAAILLATFMVATEATIVSTAMPRIVGQLGGFAFYSWVFSAYLLAQCTMTLIFGKLSDIFGRKPVMIAGLVIFMAGSLLAGVAETMAWLIGFRLLQGIGAGAVQPMAVTMVGDLFAAAERARVQAIVASVWSAAAVFGPLAGGLIVDRWAWGWIFWINLPIGALTIAIFARFLQEARAAQAARIDSLGAALFAIAILCFLLLLTATGLGATGSTLLALTSIVATALFVAQELRAPEPMISIALWRRRLVATSNAASFLIGMALVGVTTLLPLYVQGVMSRSPVIAGLTLTSLVVGWTVSLTLCGRLFKIFGVRKTLYLVCPAFPIGAALLLLLSPRSSMILASAGSLAMGLGMGLISITTIVLVQESVERSLRGSATASIYFSRSLGNALGATVLSAILTLGMTHFGRRGKSDALHRLLDEPAGLATLANDAGLRAVFDRALHWSFWGVLVIAVLAVTASWLLPIASDETPPSA